MWLYFFPTNFYEKLGFLSPSEPEPKSFQRFLKWNRNPEPEPFSAFFPGTGTFFRFRGTGTGTFFRYPIFTPKFLIYPNKKIFIKKYVEN